MKTVLAATGAFVLFLAALSTLGFGDFVMMYSPNKITCTKEAK